MYNIRVGMEIDEIFYPFAKALYGFLYNCQGESGESFEEFHAKFTLDLYERNKYITSLYDRLPFPHVVGNNIRKMSELGMEPIFISRRPEFIYHITKHFMWKFGEDFPFHFYSGDEKIDYINSNGFDYFLDVDAEVLRNLDGVCPVLYKTPWNKLESEDRFSCVTSVDKFLFYIVERERSKP